MGERQEKPGRLSVGEVARLAGVTTRTVRHYQAVGLLPEPERDSSGYRRYNSRDVITLVRAVRLRALGMPIPQVAKHLAGSTDAGGAAPASLLALASELDDEIARLAATRDRLRELARSEDFDQPVRALTRALRDSGLIAASDELRTGQEWAAALVDVVHPEGMSGVLTQASGLLSDPVAAAEFVALLERVQRLRARAKDAQVDALADKVAAIITRFVDPISLVDAELVDKIFADRLNRAQQRFVHQLRVRLGAEK